MKRLLLMVAAFAALCSQGATLEHCLEAARENYPLIRKYALMEQTQELDLSDINKGWLPRLGVYAQGTVQNVVPSFPEALSKMIDMPGLGKLQYKVGLDVTQTIWDGGASKVQREVARLRTNAERAANAVEIYEVNQRVQSIYFGILLLEAQMHQTESALSVYQSNINRLNAMIKNGAAMQSDADMVEAQMLELQQQITRARSAAKGYRQMLSVFTGEDMSAESLDLPEAGMPADMTSARPELAAFDARMALNDAQCKMTDVSLMPKAGFFAQTYYGYPGIDYFKAMTSRDLTFNLLAGVKVSWNIDAFYTRKNSLKKLKLNDQNTETERDAFLFNSTLQTASQSEEINGIKDAMGADARIVELRRRVRTAAEAQLQNGIIDATALITKINDENQAELAAIYHNIQYIQAIYNLKNTLNR